MNSIIYDNKIITPKDNKWNYYYDFTKKLNRMDCVKFALFSAKIANNNSKESNLCIGLVEKWLVDEKSVSKKELWNTATSAVFAVDAVFNAYYAVYTAFNVASFNGTINVAYAVYSAAAAASNAASSVYYAVASNASIDIINKYLQILLRKTKQFQNNKILEQISKTDVDKLELIDWNMITDIMLEEYNIIHEFSYSDIFSRRCLIELLRREYL